ncbi:transcriptional regulator [Paenibacillus terrae HPL-003]|uniref:Transcriptional regulator n=1 Tax=Paenibacillus terrae (strain HPL-003) TaxID=985665 RepID=G7W1Q6_PAETH|nr:transcriptional regulator [Paenibacillus terrae HPL-003]
MEGYTANLKQLNSGDVIQLYLTGMGIYTGGPTESGLKLKNALLKLEQTMPDSYQSDIRKAKARFYFDDTPWWTEGVAIPCLEVVRAAVWGSYKITIQYRKADGTRSSPVVIRTNEAQAGIVAKRLEILQSRTGRKPVASDRKHVQL